MGRQVNHGRGPACNRRLIGAKDRAATIRATSGTEAGRTGERGPVRPPGTAYGARFAVTGLPARSGRPLWPLARDGGPFAHAGQGAAGRAGGGGRRGGGRRVSGGSARRPPCPDQLSPPNRLVTEPSLNTSLMARATSGAIDSTVSLSNRRSAGIGSVLVTTTSLIREFLRLSTAAPDSTPWVATTITLAAPCSNSASAALVMVPPVSIMSSTRMQVRPSTWPTTSNILT